VVIGIRKLECCLNNITLQHYETHQHNEFP